MHATLYFLCIHYNIPSKLNEKEIGISFIRSNCSSLIREINDLELLIRIELFACVHAIYVMTT